MGIDTANVLFPLISLGSLSLIKQGDVKYISSNMLPGAILSSILAICWDDIIKNPKGHRLKPDEYHYSEVFIVPILICGLGEMAHMFSNLKLQYQITKNVDIYAGQNTDFFLFYNPSRISTQSAAGLKIRYKRLSASTEVRIPWTKGYYQDKKPYINFGLGYQFLKI